MNIYLSAPLFTQMERRWNRTLATCIEERIAGAVVFLPQDISFRSAYNRSDDFGRIHRACLDAIERSDVVVAVLDGADVDSGTAFEIGYASARGVPVVGVRTDYRENQDRGLNLMLAQGCTEVLRVMSFNEDVESLVRDLPPKIAAALRAADQADST